MLNRLKRALRSLLRRTQVERELDEELRYHIEQQTEQNIRLGMNPEEARYAARKAFGGVEQAKEQSRDARGVRWIEDLWQDLRLCLWLFSAPADPEDIEMLNKLKTRLHALLRKSKIESELDEELRYLSFAKTRFICIFSNLACLSPNQNFRDQNSILL